MSLVRLCAEKAREKQPQQQSFLQHPKVKPFINTLRNNYGELYLNGVQHLYVLATNEEPALVQELSSAYNALRTDGLINEIPRLDYVLRYLRIDMLTDNAIENALVQQLSQYIMDINTLKEADFCNSKSIRERVYVTTVHKAKGLEFDNVIVFDVADDRYPGYFSKDNAQLKAEDARKLYVAMTRARKRLMIMVGAIKHDYHGMPIHRNISRFMTPVLKFFDSGIIEQ